MLHGYANAWHFAWFMMSGRSSLISMCSRFYAMIEMLPKLSYGSTFRQRFAANKARQAATVERAVQALPSARSFGAVLRHGQRQSVRQSAVALRVPIVR
jgi:hypothetical protein